MRPAAHLYPSLEERARLLAVAKREEAPEFVVTGASLADVYTGTWFPANMEIVGERIAYVGPRKPLLAEATRILNAEGLWVVPGYIEPHAHPWVLYNPLSLLEALVPQGVTTVVYDDLLFRMRLDRGSSAYYLSALSGLELPARLLWASRLLPQTHLTAEEEEEFLDEAWNLLDNPWVVSSAEITAWPRIVSGEDRLLRGINRALSLGRRAEAHGAGASYERLVGLAAAGLDADHEAIRPQEVLDRLRLGFWTMLRWSSLRPDLPSLLPELPRPLASRLMLTTDGASPSFYEQKGFPALLTAVSKTGNPLEALRLATLNPATFLGLDGILGGLAPGRLADFLLLEDPESFQPIQVYLGGRLVAAEGKLVAPLPNWPLSTPPLAFATAPFGDPQRYQLDAAPCLRFENAVVTRPASPSGKAIAAWLVDRRGKWRVGAWVEGLMPALEGMATTFTAAGELLVLGSSPLAMARAAEQVVRMGGGFSWVKGTEVVWAQPLPLLGFMAQGGFAEAIGVEKTLWSLAREAGYSFGDILYTFLFLTCDFLPDLRLTPLGVLEIKKGKVLQGPSPF